MKRGWLTAVLAATVGLVLVFSIGDAAATDFTTQISKDCVSPTYIGDPYQCRSSLQNQNASGNSLVITALSDSVLTSPAKTDNLFALGTPLLFQQKSGFQQVSCTNPGVGSGDGLTLATPFIPTATTVCTLPGDRTLGQQGGKILVGNPNFSHYNVQAIDFPTLSDQITYTFHNACDFNNTSCNQAINNPQSISGSSDILQRTPQASTTITSGGSAVVTVEAGKPVIDTGNVSEIPLNQYPTPPPQPQLPGPVPSGHVTVKWFTNGNCTAPAAATSGDEALDSSGNFTATDFAQTPTTAGQYSFQATYPGDATYAVPVGGLVGPCEPLTVVDANISISPDATNEVGKTHTFTVTAKVNNGTGGGFVNVPDGTKITSSHPSGSGTVNDTNCSVTGTVGGTCTITVTNSTPGKDVVGASMTVAAGPLGNQVSITRATGDGVSTDGPNGQKWWVDANISITPDATNEVGKTHTFTVTANVNNGTGGGYVAVPDGTKITSSHPSGSGTVNDTNCSVTGTVGGTCTITVTNSTPGKDVVGASMTISAGPIPNPPFPPQATLTRATGDTNTGDSGNGQKWWVDANISISPDATNEVGKTHTFTVTANVNNGTGGGYVAVPDGTKITSSHPSGSGTVNDTNCSVTGTVGGTCTITVTNSTPGKDVVGASMTISAGPIPNPPFPPQATLTRATGDTNTGDSGNGQKWWVDANISIATNGTNPVGDTHTFTVTANVNNGTGGGYVAVPDGTKITITHVSGTGTVVSSACDTSPGTVSGICKVTVTNASAGIDVLKASMTISAGPTPNPPFPPQATLTRATGDSNTGDSGNGQKLWIVTHVINEAGGGDITGQTVAAPVTVHDTLSAAAGVDGDTVNFTLYTGSSNCTAGTGVTTQDFNGVVIGAVTSGLAISPSVTLSPSATTSYSYLATYEGTKFPVKAATCEPFTVTFQQIFSGCTPGFWKNHQYLWDQLTDAAVQGMPSALRFITTTKFDAYFNLTPAQSGFAANVTMLGAIQTGGGGKIALARHAVSALLSVGAGLNYQFPTGSTDFTSLYNLIRNTYLGTSQYTIDQLQNLLAAANNLEFNCSSLK